MSSQEKTNAREEKDSKRVVQMIDEEVFSDGFARVRVQLVPREGGDGGDGDGDDNLSFAGFGGLWTTDDPSFNDPSGWSDGY